MDIELQAALVDLYDTAKLMKNLRGQRSSIYLEKRLFDTADRITGLIAELEHEARQSQDDHTGNVPEASPDAPGDTQAPVPDQMPEPAPAEAQNGLKALHEAFDAHFASDKKNRDAAIAAWNAVHDGDLVHRSDPRANGALAALTDYRKERGL